MIEQHNSKPKRRIELDIAKGIGIILVVWAHTNAPASKYINQFHMPFFFFISGMRYLNKGRSIKEYTIRKCKSLLIPFWSWNLIFYPIFFILYNWKKWSLGVAVKQTLEIIFTVNKVPFLGATWFLPALFWVSVIVHILLKIFGNMKFADAYLFILSIIICVIGLQITFPYKISRMLICSLYYVSGYLFQKYIRDFISNRLKSFLSVGSFALFVIIASYNTVSLSANEYKFKIAFVIGAYLASFFVLWISELVEKYFKNSIFSNHIIYLGQNSIDILIWQFLAFRIAIIIQIVFLKVPMKSLVSFPVYDSSGLWWIVYLLAGIYCSLVWKYILEHNVLSKYMKKYYIIR